MRIGSTEAGYVNNSDRDRASHTQREGAAVNDRRIYAELPFRSREETLEEISSGEPERIVRAVLGAALESSESAWVEACAVSLSLVADNRIRRACLLALGHLARRVGALNTVALAAVLERLEVEEELAGTIADLKDDLVVLGVVY